jgi:hypothetical protein
MKQAFNPLSQSFGLKGNGLASATEHQNPVGNEQLIAFPNLFVQPT